MSSEDKATLGIASVDEQMVIFDIELDRYKYERTNIIENIKSSLEIFLQEFYSSFKLGENNHNTDLDNKLCTFINNLKETGNIKNTIKVDNNYEIITFPIKVLDVGIDKEYEDIIEEQEEIEEEQIYIRCDKYFIQLIISCIIDYLNNDDYQLPNFHIALTGNICHVNNESANSFEIMNNTDKLAVFLFENNFTPIEEVIVTVEDVLKLMIQVFIALNFLKENLDLNHNNLLLNKILIKKQKYFIVFDDSEIESDFIAKISDFSKSIFSIKISTDEDTEYQENKKLTFYPTDEQLENKDINLFYEEDDINSAFSLESLSFEEFNQIIHSEQRLPSSLDYYFFIVSILSNKHINNLVSDNEDILNLIENIFGTEDIKINEFNDLDGNDSLKVYEYLSKKALFTNVTESIDTFIDVLSEVEDD